MKKILRISVLNYVFLGIITLNFNASLQANQSSGLKIIAIVLSKTCPLPDGPDMTIDSPDSILKSVTNPSCPKLGDKQLIQTAIKNQGESPKHAGIEITVNVDGTELKKKRHRKVYTIQAGDTARVLHEIDLEITGRYQITVRIWDSRFKRISTRY